ncbi:hypothetical protein D1872_235540 [compost metagenome]
MVPAVSSAVYVPSPWSVIGPSTPALLLMITSSPPAVIVLPKASFSCTVTVVVSIPLAVRAIWSIRSSEVVADAGPGINSTAVDAIRFVPLTLADTTALPVSVLDHNRTE